MIDQLRRVRPESLEELPERFEPAVEVDPLTGRELSEAHLATHGRFASLSGVIDRHA